MKPKTSGTNSSKKPITLHKEILSSNTFKLLQKIQGIPEFKNFYLAGGTALALQLRHRKSVDLDFFTNVEFKSSIVTNFPEKYSVMSIFDNSIELISMDTKVFFFYFGFPLSNEVKEVDQIMMADPFDIGLMKLLALQGRTTKKDIIDLYFLDQEFIKLEILLEKFEEVYPKDSFNNYQSFKKLLDFENVKNQPEPIVVKPYNWNDCMQLVETKITKHIQQLLQV